MSKAHYLIYADPGPEESILMRIDGLTGEEAEALRSVLDDEHMDKEPFRHTFRIDTEEGKTTSERLMLRKRAADAEREAIELRQRADLERLSDHELRWLSAHESAVAYIEQLNDLRHEAHEEEPPDLTVLADELDTMADHATPPHRLNELMRQWSPQTITHGEPVKQDTPLPYSELEEPPAEDDAEEAQPDQAQANGERADAMAGEAKAPADDGKPYFPPDHFRHLYGIPGSRLREARRTGRVRGVRAGKRWHYSEPDARKQWPNDVVDGTA